MTLLIFIQFFKYYGTSIFLALASLFKQLHKSQSPHVTNVKFFDCRQCCSLIHSSNFQSTAYSLSLPVTMSWVMPVSSVQNLVSSGLQVGVTYSWNWFTIFLCLRSTTITGNSMIYEHGLSLTLSQQVASKSSTSRYSRSSVTFTLGTSRMIVMYLRSGLNFLLLNKNITICDSFSIICCPFVSCQFSICCILSVLMASWMVAFLSLLIWQVQTLFRSVQLLINQGWANFLTLSSLSKHDLIVQLPHVTKVQLCGLSDSNVLIHFYIYLRVFQISVAVLICQLVSPVMCVQQGVSLGLHLGLTSLWNLPTALASGPLTFTSTALIQIAYWHGFNYYLSLQVAWMCRQIRYSIGFSFFYGYIDIIVYLILLLFSYTHIKVLSYPFYSFYSYITLTQIPMNNNSLNDPILVYIYLNIANKNINMNLIPLFIQSHQKQHQEQLTSDAIPDSGLVLNPEVQLLIDRPTPICLITAVVHSQKAKQYLRSMLFQTKSDDIQLKFNKTDTIFVYKKLNVGYGVLSQPFNWIYFQIDSRSQSKIAEMVTSVSCTLIYEAFTPQMDVEYIQKYIKQFKQITGKHPSLFYLKQQSQIQQVSFNFKVNYNQIILPNQNNRQIQQLSIIQSIAQNQKKIIGDSFCLQNKKGQFFSSAVLVQYFKKWELQSNYENIEKPQIIWNQAIDILEHQLKLKCLEQYQSRMSKLYEDKKFVSLKLLKNSHELSMEIALKSIQKYKINKQNFLQELEMLINQQLNKIVQQISQLNLKWGKSFIESEFGQIETRLKNKDVKLMSSLKHQFNMFIEYFRKKAEALSCKKLQNFFEQFVVQKAIDCCAIVLQNQKKINQKQIAQIKNKLTGSQNQIKQLKRQINKQSIQALNNVDSLHQKINYYKNRQQLLQSTIAQLKSQKNQIDDQYDNKITEIQKSFMEQLNQLKQSKIGFADQIGNLKRKIVILEAEIEKQRQMHKQTQQYYKQMINEFRTKQLQLKDQISDITLRAGQQLEEYRRDSMRQLNQSTISKSEKQKEGQKLIEQINLVNHRYSQLEKAYNNIQYEFQLNKAEYQTIKTDLEIALKIAQQKVCEYQSRMPRYQKLEQQVVMSQKIIEQSTTQRKGIEKQVALLKQQNIFISQQYQQYVSKYENQKIMNLELKNSLYEMQQKVSKLETVKVNQWVQTEFDHKLKKQLEDALHLTTILEAEYKKVKLQNSRLRYRLQ